MSDNTNNKNGPVEVVKDGAIRSAVFRNEGDKGPYFTTTIEKRWQDDDGNWHSTARFSEREALRASEVLRKSHDVMIGLRHEQSKMREEDDGNRREEYRERGRSRSSSQKRGRRR